MRELIYTNPNGVSVTLGGAPSKYFITSVDGLGSPVVSLQTQKAPYQDGVTLIDQLNEPRTITVEGAITDLDEATLSTSRRTLISTLNPKLGAGTLSYKNENGNIYYITALPIDSPILPNRKRPGDIMQKFMVQFYCADPYWRKTTATTGTLYGPVCTKDAHITVASNGISALRGGKSFIRMANDHLAVCYVRDADNFIALRISEDAGVTWGAEIAISAADNKYASFYLNPAVPAFLGVAAIRTADSYIVKYESADYGATWGAAAEVVAAACDRPVAIKQLDDNYRIVYMRTVVADIKLFTRQGTALTTAALGAEVAIDADPIAAIDGGISFMQFDTGELIVCAGGSGSAQCWRSSAVDVWSNPITITSAAIHDWPFCVQKIGDDMLMALFHSDDAAVTYPDGIIYAIFSLDRGLTWGSGFSSTYYKACYNTDAKYYGEFIIEPSGACYYIYEIANGQIEMYRPDIIANNGDIDTGIQFTLTGKQVNPLLVNPRTEKLIDLTETQATGNNIAIDTSFGVKTIDINKGTTPENGIALITANSNFYNMKIGDSALWFLYEDNAPTDAPVGAYSFTEKYLGV